MPLRFWSLLAVLAALSAGSAQTPPPAGTLLRAQHPAVSPDGTRIAFSWQGDLWVVAASGGRAERITVHPATDNLPVWSPDGARIVFASNRYGNQDVFSIAADGSDLRRLTFDSSSETPTDVTATHVYGHTNAWGRSDIFRIPVAGGALVRLSGSHFEREFLPKLSPDGRTIVYNRGGAGPGAWRKPGVKGTGVGDLWIADHTVPLSNHRVLARNDDNDLFPTPAPDGGYYFVSNRGGWPNIWKTSRDGRQSRPLTRHSDGTVRYPSLSRDGKVLAYEFNSEIWILDTSSSESRKLAVTVPGDARSNPVQELTVTAGLSDFAVSPDGKRTVIVVRGELFLIPERGGTTRRLTQNPALDEQPLWLDNRRILYVKSGPQGKRELATVTIDGEHGAFLSDPRADLTAPSLSPDGKTLAFHRAGEEIVVVPATGGTPRPIVRGNFSGSLRGGPSFSWSPDSKWLAIAQAQARGGLILLAEVEGSRRIVAGRTARGSSTPKFLPNGRGVVFTANEFGTGSDLFVIDLVPGEVTFSEDDLDKIDEPKPTGRPTVEVEIVEAGIESRMRRLTSNGAFGAEPTADGRGVYTVASGGPGVASQLVTVPVAGGASSPVTGVQGPASNLKLFAGKLYFTNGGRFFSLPTGAQAAAPINFSAQMRIDLRSEEQAIFNEIWWAIDRLYYDNAFHGKNWAGIRDKFARIVPFATDRSDFYGLIDEMLEELDSSHLDATPPPTAGGDGESTAQLGVHWDPRELDARGRYVVSGIVPGSPADHPQSKLQVGDRLVTIDGEAPTLANPVSALLNNKAGRRVDLRVERQGRTIQIAIKPVTSGAISALEYEAWVSWQRAETERLSNGQLTYVHIQGMNQTSLDRFKREIRTLSGGKKGVIVDVRFNGGGNTADDVLGILIKQPWLIRTTRGPENLRISENIFRGDSLELPTLLMINHGSASNAEVLAEGFRRLKIGPIVGERTPGFVIGTSGITLWDGGSVRLPAIGAYTIDGENLENNGRRPDFNVWFDPNAESVGRDVQLEKAVEELLKRVR